MFGVSIFNSSRRISRDGAVIAGGMTNDAGSQSNYLQKFYFSIEDAAQIGTLTSAFYGSWSAGYVGSRGYSLAGYGYDGNNSYAVQNDFKVEYSTNTVTYLGSPFGSSTKVNSYDGSDVSTKSLSFTGYDLVSGWTTAGKKFVFATETGSSISATVSSVRGHVFVMNNNSTALYAAGGHDINNWVCDTTTIDKISYATETRSTLSAPISKNRDTSGETFSNAGVKGYATAGFDGNCSTQSNGAANTYTISYSNDTRSNMSTYLWSSGSYPTSISKSGFAGYYAGSRSSTVIQRWLFSNDTTSTLSSSMSQQAGRSARLVNSLGNS